jgi:hypothetical protein
MLRDNESLHVRLTPDFGLDFILRRDNGDRGVRWQSQKVSEQKLRVAAAVASRDEMNEQVATLIRFLQKMIDKATGEPDRVTCPACGWLAGEKKERGDGFRCFNCRADFRNGDDY